MICKSPKLFINADFCWFNYTLLTCAYQYPLHPSHHEMWYVRSMWTRKFSDVSRGVSSLGLGVVIPTSFMRSHICPVNDGFWLHFPNHLNILHSKQPKSSWWWLDIAFQPLSFKILGCDLIGLHSIHSSCNIIDFFFFCL